MKDKNQSMFIGPENKRKFGKDDPYFVPEPTKWNRSLFYSKETKLVDYESLNIKLDLNNLESVEGKSGVWALWGSKDENSDLICLDVHETLDIGYEIRMHEKELERARNTPWDDHIYTNDNRFSLSKRSKAITQWKNLTVILVALNIYGKINREAIEAQYAWDTKSFYWNRNYFQAVTPETLALQRENDYIKNLR